MHNQWLLPGIFSAPNFFDIDNLCDPLKNWKKNLPDSYYLKKNNNQQTLVQTTNHGSFVLEAFNPKFLNSIDQVPKFKPTCRLS